MVFREVDGKGKIAFVNDGNGPLMAHVNYDIHYPSVVFQQVNNPLYKKSFNTLILGFILSIILLTLIAWPIGAMIRKYYMKPLILTKNEKRLRTIVYIVCLSIVVYFLGLLIFATMLSDFSMLSERSDKWLRILQVVAWISVAGSLPIIYNSFRCWTDKQKSFWSKIWNSFLALASIGFCWFIYHWNLLNFYLKY